MPAKGRRIASRQAELGRRKRRAAKLSEGVSSRPLAPVPGTETSASNEAMEAAEAAPVGAGTARVATRTRTSTTAAGFRPRAQAPGRARAEAGNPYLRVIPELRRIFIVAGTLIIALIVISFFI